MCYLDIKRSKLVILFIWFEVVLSYSKIVLFWYLLLIDIDDFLRRKFIVFLFI